MNFLPDRIFQTKFSTDIFTDDEKVDAYIHDINAVFDVDIYKASRSTLYANIETYLVNDIILVDCETIGQHFHRSRSKIAQDGLDHIIVQYFFKGGTQGNLKSDQLPCTPETTIFIDTSKPWSAYNPEFKNFSVIIPRHQLLSRGINPDMLHGLIMRHQENHFASLSWTYIKGIKPSLPYLSNSQATYVKKTIIDLICAAIKTLNEPGFEGSLESPSLSLRVRNFIFQNLHDPELDIHMVARNLRLPTSLINKIFPPEFGGVERFIQKKRLGHVFHELESQTKSSNIFEIISKYGFKDFHEFNRCFRKRFDLDPRYLLNLSNEDSRVSKEIDRISYTQWHRWLECLP